MHDIPGIIVKSHSRESELYNSWREEVAEIYRPDCVVMYNGLSFDNQYMITRANRDSLTDFFRLSKLQNEVIKPQSKMLTSSSMGDNEQHHLPMSGRFSIDMFHWIKTRFPHHKSLKLDDISREYLGADDGKIDLPYRKITEAFVSGGTIEDRTEVVRYCRQDCDLPLRLLEKLCTIEEVSEMSRVCKTLINDVLTRGQQIKVYSHMLIAAHRLGYIMNDLPKGSDDKYEGATVLNPDPGFYNSIPVVCLDYASLYPSIMRSKNLCFSSWVPPGVNLPPFVQYEEFDLGGGRTSRFVSSGSHKGYSRRY